MTQKQANNKMFEKLIPYDTAHLILGAYFQYYHQFKRITKRGKIRFEHRDWHGSQQDIVNRTYLYKDLVGETTEKVLEFLGENAENRKIWEEIKSNYLEEILNFNTRNIAETFYNSVFRHSHKGLSADEDLMFVHATGTYREFKSTQPIFHNFIFSRLHKDVIRRIFEHYHFDVPFEDLERDIEYILSTLKKMLAEEGFENKEVRLEILKSMFFRNKGCYIAGRMKIGQVIRPFVMPLLNREEGIFVDALLLHPNDISPIFGYNRTYFLVDVDIVHEMVDFLRSMMPTKSLGELYNSIGFEKHGKTVFYRDFLRHLEVSDDKFIIAPGIKGMVMHVFTLPSYNVVFKIIKDHFAPPKNVTEKVVKEKYQIVSLHDRVGRMADSHMFENLVFERSRFSEDLLEELMIDAPSKVILTEKTVEIKHLYVEKKMIPLNLYLEKSTLEEAEHVIDEYGLAIKQLACVNIFPGDMLLKNFGVTRLKRVVFYDYDEIGFLTDYNFRIIPEPRDEYEEMSSQPYFHVGVNDIFPEEFPRFLIGRADIREIFYRLHGDLYNVKYWKGVQKQLTEGVIMDVYPYKQRLRFENVFLNENE